MSFHAAMQCPPRFESIDLNSSQYKGMVWIPEDFTMGGEIAEFMENGLISHVQEMMNVQFTKYN